MRLPASMDCTKAARFGRPPVGHTPGESSTICTRTANHHCPEALDRIRALYAVEDQVRGKPPDQRRAFRQEHAAPLLKQLHQWLVVTLATVSAKSEAARAINYSLKLWAALTRYIDDGNIEIDNNAAERALRGPVLSRKNFLFAGADSAASAPPPCTRCWRPQSLTA